MADLADKLQAELKKTITLVAELNSIAQEAIKKMGDDDLSVNEIIKILSYTTKAIPEIDKTSKSLNEDWLRDFTDFSGGP